jgi:hypothetical protein
MGRSSVEENTAEENAFTDYALERVLSCKAQTPLARGEKSGFVIDLVGRWSFGDLPAHRMTILLFLLLAVKDRATEIRFEPSRFPESGDDGVGFRVSYEVDGLFYDLMPPPFHLKPALCREIETLARFDSLRLRAAHLLRRLASKLDGGDPAPRRGHFTLGVEDTKLDVDVLAYASDRGERYVLKLGPISAALSETVQAEMKRIMEVRRVKPVEHSP